MNIARKTMQLHFYNETCLGCFLSKFLFKVSLVGEARVKHHSKPVILMKGNLMSEIQHSSSSHTEDEEYKPEKLLYILKTY